MPRAAGEPHVERIISHRLGIGEASLAVRLGEHDRLDEPLHVPRHAAIGQRMRELPGEQVEHLRIFRSRGLIAEILGRLHESDPEKRLPEPVDRHAGEQGMVGIDQPAGEPEAVLRLIRWKRRQDGGCVGFHGLAPLVVIAALEHEGRVRLR